MKPRKAILRFTNDMELKLCKNDHKDHWSGMSLQYLSMRLTQERKELERAIKSKDAIKIVEECADVANFAMMIADNARRDSKEEKK